MKIVLYAFGGKLKSYQVMDVPESTMPTFDMVLTNPVVAISGFDGQKIGERAGFTTRCRFEFTGKFHMLDDDSSARVYELVDIVKF